jgi:TolB-like protein/DNA-binding winged helix-turn-helix (wHTH) protein/Flp pilus assembly protein TadD
MASQPIEVQPSLRFGEDFELDFCPRRLRRGRHLLKLERIPLELLVLLLERHGELVTREEIVARIWGSAPVFDTDNSIRSAIRKIRQVLKDDSEQPRFIETIIGQGYRFLGPIMAAGQETSAPAPSPLPPVLVEQDLAEQITATPTNPESDLPHGTRSSRFWLLVGGAALLVLLAAAYFISRQRAPNLPARIKSIAVLPLKNLSGDPAQDYLADGMTEELIGRLAAIHDLRVISRTSVMNFKNTQLSVPQISKMMAVDAVVEGSVIRDGSRVRVHAQLIRSATDEHFWSETYDRELRDVLGLESDVAEAIAKKVEVTVSGEEHSRLVAARNVSAEVYESFLKGQYALSNAVTPDDVKRSIVDFNQAIQHDATFAPAHLGLAAAYNFLDSVLVGGDPGEYRQKVISEDQKAIELDPSLAGAHILLAGIYQSRWQWREAESEYQKALALQPNDPDAHGSYAGWLLSQGRTSEAVDWAKRARELDPFSAAGGLEWTLFQARHYDEALRELHASLAVRPDDAFALWCVGFVLIAKGQSQQAIAVLEKARSVSHDSPGITGVLVSAYAHAGRRTDALRVLSELKRRREKGYVPAAAFVQAYLGLDDKDQAFASLEQAYKEHSDILQFLKTESTFDLLRSDPRFNDLLHRVGLGPNG